MGWLDSVGGFFKHVGEDTAHVAEDGWNAALKGAKESAHVVGTAVRNSDAENARLASLFDSGEQYVVDKINDGRAWLRQHGGVAGKVASDYIGFEEGVGESVYGAAKGLVQLAYGAEELSNPLEWAANPEANIARVKSAISSGEALGKIANLVDNPTSWITDPEGNERLATGLWHSAATSYDKDPSEFLGNAAGTIALFFIPGADGAAAAGDAGRAEEVVNGAVKVAKGAEEAEQGTEIADNGANAGRVVKGGEEVGDAGNGTIPQSVIDNQKAQDNLIANQQKQLKEAIDQDGGEGGKIAKGRVLNQQGADFQNITDDTLRQIKDARVDPNVPVAKGPGSEIDDVVQRGDKKVYVESKLTIAKPGTRMINQLTNVTKVAKPGDTVILMVARQPTAAEISHLRDVLGDAVFDKVKIVSSQTALFKLVNSALTQ